MFHRAGTKNPADGPSRRPDYWSENDSVHLLLPEGRLRLVETALVELERVKPSGGREVLMVIDMPIPSAPMQWMLPRTDGRGTSDVDSDGQDTTPGAAECTQHVPRRIARELVGETVLEKPSIGLQLALKEAQ